MIFQKYTSIFKSNNGKALISNFSYLMLLQVASYLFPLITLPYLSRVIGAEGFGRIALATAIISWVQTIADWGFSYTATRDVAKNRDDKNAVSQIITNVTWARLFLSLVCLAVLVVLMLFIPLFRENALVILFTYLLVPGHVLFPDWFFQAIEKMQYITIFNVLSKLGCLIAVFVFIKEPDDYLLQPLFISLGYIISGIVAVYYIFYKWQYKFMAPNVHAIKCTLSDSKDVFVNNLVPNLYNSFSTMLLSFLCGNTATGKLDAGFKFSGALQQFNQVIFRTFFPFLSRRIDKHRSFALLSMSISFVLCLVLFVFSPQLIHLFYPAEFDDCVALCRIGTVSVFFLSLSIIYGTNYLIIIHKEKYLRNITTISSIVGFVAAYPLISKFGAIGAAITICLSRGLMGILSLIVAKQKK